MPLTAKQKSTGKVICIIDYEQPRLALSKGDIECKLCGVDMIVRQGQVKRPHFAHVRGCETAFDFHPESIDHLAAKAEIMDVLREQFGSELSSVEAEVPLPEAKRIADVMATFKTGWQVAHEIQLASITIEQLQARTTDYHADGVEVYWWLGKNANTESNRNWVIDSIGCVGILEFAESKQDFRKLREIRW